MPQIKTNKQAQNKPTVTKPAIGFASSSKASIKTSNPQQLPLIGALPVSKSKFEINTQAIEAELKESVNGLKVKVKLNKQIGDQSIKLAHSIRFTDNAVLILLNPTRITTSARLAEVLAYCREAIS